MAGGARPDPFRTRKLSRRAPMVLRGQPVGEQGAADRWTALDPYQAGSGAGAPRGDPSAAPPFFICLRSSTFLVYTASHFAHIEKPKGSIRALRGPFFMPRGPAIERRIPWPLVCGPDGVIHVGSGAGRRLPRGAPPFSRGRSCRRGGACPVGSRGPCPRTRGLAAACRSGRPARSRGRRPGVRPVRWPSRSALAVSPASRASLSAGPRPRRPDRAPGRVPQAP